MPYPLVLIIGVPVVIAISVLLVRMCKPYHGPRDTSGGYFPYGTDSTGSSHSDGPYSSSALSPSNGHQTPQTHDHSCGHSDAGGHSGGDAGGSDGGGSSD